MQRMGSREMAMEILNFPFQADFWESPATEERIDMWGNIVPARPEGLHIYGPTFEVLPEGWTLLGQGISRVAFLAPDGFVYKVPHYALNEGDTGGQYGKYEGFKHTNFAEAMTYAVFGDLIASENPGYRLADSEYLYDLDVQVMEYVEKSEEGYPVSFTTIENMFGKYGITDLHGSNVWQTDKGDVVVIDYAATRF